MAALVKYKSDFVHQTAEEKTNMRKESTLFPQKVFGFSRILHMGLKFLLLLILVLSSFVL